MALSPHYHVHVGAWLPSECYASLHCTSLDQFGPSRRQPGRSEALPSDSNSSAIHFLPFSSRRRLTTDRSPAQRAPPSPAMNGNNTTVTATAYPSHGQLNGYSPVHNTPQATAAAALSEQDAAPPAKKRKASGVPGSRGVANLTPEQLAKKRANDREAQRAIRERTRNNIATLEQRIRELESQQPFQELQRVVTERDNALRECEDLRRRLATVAQLVGTATGGSNGGQNGVAGASQLAPASLNGTLWTFDEVIDPSMLNSDGVPAELAALTAQQSPLPPISSTTSQSANNPFPSHGGHASYAGEQQHVHPDLREQSYGAHASPVSATSQPDARRWEQSVASAQYSPPQQPVSGLQYDQQLPPPAQMQQHPTAERDRLGLNYIMDQGSPAQQQHAPPSPPISSRLPSNSPPSCPLDSLLSDFLARRRQLVAEGTPLSEVLGPEYPSFSALKDPHNPIARQDQHAISALLIDILSKFPDISALPEKVAVLYIMFLIMRWCICPCDACYDRMPEWVRPVAEQLERPHPEWVDNLPWSVESSSSEDGFSFDAPSFWGSPGSSLSSGTMAEETAEEFANTFLRPYMRARLSSVDTVRFDEFFVPFTTTLSLNWQYPADQVLIQEPAAEAEDLRLNPTFETHLRDLKNWSLGREFANAFPDLVEDVPIQDLPRGPSLQEQ